MNMVKTVNSYAEGKNKRGFDWVLHLGDVCAWGGSWSFWKEMYSQDAFRSYMWAGLNGNHDNMSRKYQLTNQYFKNATANPLNGYEGLLYLLRETYSKKGWNVQNPHLPIRFISGKDDPCMLSERKFFKAVNMLEKLGYESISHRLFDGMRHEVLNEKNNINVWKDIAKTLFSWIDRYNDSQSDAAFGTETEQPSAE